MRAMTNLTHLFMTNPVKADNTSRITIKNSKFSNLNAMSIVRAMAGYGGSNPFIDISTNVIDPFSLPNFIHKGIVLNLEDFGGRVEITGSTFERNMHFIPNFYYKYRDSLATGNKDAFYDSQTTKEYKMKYCDLQSLKEKYFFNSGFS